jgi:hypothetical protein
LFDIFYLLFVFCYFSKLGSSPAAAKALAGRQAATARIQEES